ncbi:hypothetical protein NKG05_29040 [Oerskovia sp. M15]
MTEHGYAVKEAYLSALRGGHRTSPSLRIIEGLAAFFGVEPRTCSTPVRTPRRSSGSPCATTASRRSRCGPRACPRRTSAP